MEEGWLSIERSARLIGLYHAIEHELFVTTGRWMTEAARPDVRLHLDEVSSQHAWHAQLWAERLPVFGRLDRRALTTPTPALATLAQRLREPLLRHSGTSLEDVDVLRLAALYRVVLPRLIVTYRQHIETARPESDAPVIRSLRLALRDELDAWPVGEVLLERLVADVYGKPEDRADVGSSNHIDAPNHTGELDVGSDQLSSNPWAFCASLDQMLVQSGLKMGLVPLWGDP